MWSDRIRAMTGGHWIALFALIILAWGALYAMGPHGHMATGSGQMAAGMDHMATGSEHGAGTGGFWSELAALTPQTAGFLRVVLMWALMSAAMMVPTALPALATYDDLSRVSTRARFWPLVAGYVAVWVGFSVLAAAMQMGLFSAGLIDAMGESLSVGLSAGLLAGAGVYQFSRLKAGCLSKCRQPMTFFMQHWDEGPWRNGLRLGVACLGCCWALMLLGFVGGAMNLAFMGLAMVIMVVEKLPAVGRHVTRPLGVALIGAAGWALAGGL